jgi:hypothetical protein
MNADKNFVFHQCLSVFIRGHRSFLGGMCVAVLCGILVAGLWPFHAPKNKVTWLAGENGLRFDYAGTIMSAGEFQPSVSPESPCSIEVWAQPALLHDSNTLLAFHTARNPIQLALLQSDTDLKVQHNLAPGPHGRRTEAFYIDNAFRSLRPLFITVSSGAEGTAVYIDGVLVRAAPSFRITANDCTGRLVVATSPVGNDDWTGQLRGLAIYRGELTPAQVARHYETWTGKGRPDLTGEERCVALYLFQEHGGNRVHSQVGSGPDLLIPERYQIVDQAFLAPFWKEFDLSWGYWKNAVKNVVGFVPLGFFFCAYFSLKPSVRRPALVTTILGVLVSITIEVLQAYLPTRDSGTTDIITNTFGTWVGVMLYRYVAATVGTRAFPH